MKIQPRFVAMAVAVAVVFVVSINIRFVSAQTAAEADCRATVAKQVSSHLNKVLKAMTKCHGLRAKDKVSPATNCNDLADADPDSKLASSRSKVTSAVTEACGSTPAVIALYGRCPSPAAAADDTGTAGIDNAADLAACMIGLVEGLAPQAMIETAGKPEGSLPKSLAKCQKQLAKSMSKTLVTTVKERARCQAARDAQTMGLDYGCAGEDADGKIQKAFDKLDSGIEKRCNVDNDSDLTLKQELDELDACADTVEDLQHCVGDIVATRLGSGMSAMAYELPSTCLGGTVLRVLQSGAGEEFTDTFLSTGWTGTSHIVDVLDNAQETVTVTCDDDCANCTMNLDLHKGQPDAICRCALDPTNDCDVFNGTDVDDCGLVDTCNCNFGAPLPLSSGGTPVCVLNRHRTDITNTAIDLGTGLQSGTVNDTATVFFGENTDVVPCPVCEDDVTPNDGLRDGTCSQGLRINQPCDTNATHPDFGPTSHDCPPNLITNVSGSGLFLTQPFSTSAQSLAYNLPCTNPIGELCPCLVCTNDTLRGCASNADCEAPGECTTVGPQVSAESQPNDCSDGMCTCDGDPCSSGTCMAGPSEMYCDGIVRQNGRGFLECTTPLDCATINAGGCTISQLRKCLDDPIEIEGSGTIFTINDSALFCIAPTTSDAVNLTAGLPGPGVVTLSAETTTFCASDSSLEWEPPGGTNCPP